MNQNIHTCTGIHFCLFDTKRHTLNTSILQLVNKLKKSRTSQETIYQRRGKCWKVAWANMTENPVSSSVV